MWQKAILNGSLKKLQMEINDELLEQITEAANKGFAPRDIAIMVSIPFSEFKQAMAKEDTPIYAAFMKGLLQGEFDLWKEIERLALLGSSPAQALMQKRFEEVRMKMIER